MKFLADENISPKSVNFLQSLGFDAVHVSEIGLKGKPDEEIMEYALGEGRVLLTLDRDFADVRNYPPGSHAGIIRMRLGFASPQAVNTCLDLLLRQLPDEDVKGNLVVTDGLRYRIRRKAGYAGLEEGGRS